MIVIRKNKYNERIGEEVYDKNGCLMKIIEYNNCNDITVEFQDEYKARVHASYTNFKRKDIKNPYFPSVQNVGMIGVKYPSRINKLHTKEYIAWNSMLKRCFGADLKERNLTYKDITCCKEWLLYENFYEWLHEQENFDKWLNGDKWEVDKDILIKGNKIYSPETCCLVPHNVNCLFVKSNSMRKEHLIGTGIRNKNRYVARCNNGSGITINLGTYSSQIESFYIYKDYKENLIKQIAKEEFLKGNITKKCYDAMMKYEVKITD